MSQAFRDACVRLNVRHLRTKPYTPRTKRKAERFIQSCLRECSYAEAHSPKITEPRPSATASIITSGTDPTPR